MRRRPGVLYLGEVYSRTQLERCGHVKRRTRADYLWALRAGASSNLYRITDDVRCDRDRAGTCRRNYRCASRIPELLDKIASRGKSHAQTVSERVRGLSTARETLSFRSSFKTSARLAPPSTSTRRCRGSVEKPARPQR